MKKLSKVYKKLGIDFTFPIRIKNAKGKKTYFEGRTGHWYKMKYDSDGRETYFEDSNSYRAKWEYDANGNETYFENVNGDKRGTPKAKTCDGETKESEALEAELKTKEN